MLHSDRREGEIESTEAIFESLRFCLALEFHDVAIQSKLVRVRAGRLHRPPVLEDGCDESRSVLGGRRPQVQILRRLASQK
jgi:hypothetical protein